MKPDKIVARLQAFLPAELREARRRLRHRGSANHGRAIHDVRKSIKKLRAALRLAADMAPDKTLEVVEAPLRAAAHALGPLRDHLVLGETARAVARRGERPPILASAPPSPPILKKAGADLRKAAAGLSHLLQEGFDPKGAKKGLRAIFKRARRAMKQAAKTAFDDDLHAWRRRAKDLYYVADSIEAPASVVKKLKRLTQFLGKDHDLATFVAHHDSTAERETHHRLLQRARKRRGPLQKKAFRLGEDLFAETPRHFARQASK